MMQIALCAQDLVCNSSNYFYHSWQKQEATSVVSPDTDINIYHATTHLRESTVDLQQVNNTTGKQDQNTNSLIIPVNQFVHICFHHESPLLSKTVTRRRIAARGEAARKNRSLTTAARMIWGVFRASSG